MAFVRLYHDDPGMTGGPTTADVPEEAVPHWRKAGWHEAEKGRPENADNVESPQGVRDRREDYGREDFHLDFRFRPRAGNRSPPGIEDGNGERIC